MISCAQIEEFKERGVLVIPQVLQSHEVETARSGLHAFLAQKAGVHIDRLGDTAAGLTKFSSTGGSGGVLDVFYEEWKLSLNEHPTVVQVIMELWEQTFAAPASNPLYQHPFGSFDPYRGLMYIDRICFRVPESISTTVYASDSKSSSSGSGSGSGSGSTHINKKSSKPRTLQRSLTPHIDCCPHKMFQAVGDKTYNKWRPIQAFVALTDTLDPQMGGFEACPGFHKEFAEWADQRARGLVVGTSAAATAATTATTAAATAATAAIAATTPAIPVWSPSGVCTTRIEPPCVGQFTPIRPKEDHEVLQRFEHIPIRAGDLVLWDYRIPHANSYRNDSDHAREVVYIGLLPDVDVNRQYAVDQLENFGEGIVPTDQWHEHKEKQPCAYKFSPLGRKLMGIDPW